MKYLPMTVVVMLLTMIFIPLSVNAEEIKMDIIPSKIEYLSNENLTVYYSIYLSNGRISKGGEGEWSLVYNINETQIARGTLKSANGKIIVNLRNHNITMLGYDTYLRFKLAYFYDNSWYNDSKLIKIMNAERFYFSVLTDPLSGGYYPGSYVKIRIKSPVGMLNVKQIKVSSQNELFLSIANSLQLDTAGYGEYYFTIPENVAIGTKINVSVEIENKIETESFTVAKNFGLYFYSKINLKEDVLSGERINLTVMSSEKFNEGYFHYYVYDSNGVIIKHVATNKRYFDYNIPDKYTGLMEIRCEVYNSTENIGSLIQVLNVVSSKMYVYFDKLSYREGDTLHLYVNFHSIVIKSPEFVYDIFGDYGNGYLLLKSVNTEKREIEIKVPDNPPFRYMIEVHLMSNISSTVRAAQIEYAIPAGFKAYILTQSPYINNVFGPGQDIEIHFKIMKSNIEGGRIYYGFGDEFYTSPHVLVLHNESEGNLVVKIPKYVKTGIYEIHLMLLYDGGVENSSVFVNVDSNPPWTLYSILGMPLGDFIVLIILVVLIVAIFLYFYTGKERGKRGDEVKDSQ